MKIIKLLKPGLEPVVSEIGNLRWLCSLGCRPGPRHLSSDWPPRLDSRLSYPRDTPPAAPPPWPSWASPFHVPPLLGVIGCSAKMFIGSCQGGGGGVIGISQFIDLSTRQSHGTGFLQSSLACEFRGGIRQSPGNGGRWQLAGKCWGRPGSGETSSDLVTGLSELSSREEAGWDSGPASHSGELLALAAAPL